MFRRQALNYLLFLALIYILICSHRSRNGWNWTAWAITSITLSLRVLQRAQDYTKVWIGSSTICLNQVQMRSKQSKSEAKLYILLII
jgi:hypothetical protein